MSWLNNSNLGKPPGCHCWWHGQKAAQFQSNLVQIFECLLQTRGMFDASLSHRCKSILTSVSCTISLRNWVKRGYLHNLAKRTKQRVLWNDSSESKTKDSLDRFPTPSFWWSVLKRVLNDHLFSLRQLIQSPQCTLTYFQYSSLGLVLLVRLTTSVTPATRLVVALARVALRGLLTTPLQSGVFQGLLQYVHGSNFVMDMKK